MTTDITPAEPISGKIETHLDLPSGGWVELRDPRLIRTRDRKRIAAQMPDEGTKAFVGLSMAQGLPLLLVAKWSVPYAYLSEDGAEDGTKAGFNGSVKLGITIDDVDALMTEDGDALTEFCEPAMRFLFPKTASPDDMSPGSPTPPVGE